MKDELCGLLHEHGHAHAVQVLHIWGDCPNGNHVVGDLVQNEGLLESQAD